MPTFTVQLRLQLDIERTIVAETFEEAIAAGAALVPPDIVRLRDKRKDTYVDSEIKVSGVWRVE